MSSATALGLVLFLALSATPASAEVANITVEPHSLAMGSMGGSVSVHTDIDYSEGPWGPVTLNDLPALYTKSDLCGNLVAKFDTEAVKGMVEEASGGLLVLSFSATGEDVTYTGTDTMNITVKFNKK